MSSEQTATNTNTTPSTIPTSWDASFDVVVVGSGFAGLAAASEAAAAGAKTLIVDKMSYCGGNSAISGGGYCCWDSKLKLREKLNLGEDSWQLHAQDTLKGGGYYNDPELVNVLAQQAPAGLDWLVDAGVEFRDTVARIGGHSAYRSYQAATTGKKLIKLLANVSASNGAEIWNKTKVEWIFRETLEQPQPQPQPQKQPILGIQVNQDGRPKTVQAKQALIIAAGGYGADVQLRTTYKPTLSADCNCTNHKGATGEMIRLAKAVGADTTHLEFVQLYPCAEPDSGNIDQPAFLCFSGTGFGLIFVNQDGQRFVNELSGREQISNAQLLNQPKPTFSVLNAAIFAKLGIGNQEIEKMVKRGRVLTGDTVQELAKKIDVPSAQLTQTVQLHNNYIAQSQDADFNKPMTEQMIPLQEGPFYAIAQWPSVHYCMGGIRINPKAEVLDIWGTPISGLFAAGEVCGGVHGIDRLGGNGIAECIVFGLIAGRNAFKA